MKLKVGCKMKRDLPHLSVELIARREARGLTRQDMAGLLGVDVTTVTRWEQGRNRPKGQHVTNGLREYYGLSQQQLDALFVDWVRRHKGSSAFELWGYEYLSARGIDEYDLLEKLIDIDTAMVPEFRLEDAGTIEYWAPVFHAFPYSWKLLVKDGEIAGYWHYLCLQEGDFDLMKRGMLHDTSLTLDRLEYPVFLEEEREYRMLLSMIALDMKFLSPISSTILLKSFVDEVLNLATAGMYFSEICASVYTATEAHFFEALGLVKNGYQQEVSSRKMAEIYLADMSNLNGRGALGRMPELIEKYDSHFGNKRRRIS